MRGQRRSRRLLFPRRHKHRDYNELMVSHCSLFRLAAKMIKWYYIVPGLDWIHCPALSSGNYGSTRRRRRNNPISLSERQTTTCSELQCISISQISLTRRMGQAQQQWVKDPPNHKPGHEYPRTKQPISQAGLGASLPRYDNETKSRSYYDFKWSCGTHNPSSFN